MYEVLNNSVVISLLGCVLLSLTGIKYSEVLPSFFFFFSLIKLYFAVEAFLRIAIMLSSSV